MPTSWYLSLEPSRFAHYFLQMSFIKNKDFQQIRRHYLIGLCRNITCDCLYLRDKSYVIENCVLCQQNNQQIFSFHLIPCVYCSNMIFTFKAICTSATNYWVASNLHEHERTFTKCMLSCTWHLKTSNKLRYTVLPKFEFLKLNFRSIKRRNSTDCIGFGSKLLTPF